MDKFVRKIGIGTAQFGLHYGISNVHGQTPLPEISNILEKARQHKITIIDTASAYGNAEKVLGRHDLSSFKVVSKFLPPERNGKISGQLKQSLKNLKLSSLYGYLAHRPGHFAENLYLWKELQSLKADGFIKKIGFSLNTPEELKNLLQKRVQPDIIQVPFNYFDRRFKDLMIQLKEAGCEIHARSAFLQGLFFMDIEQLDSYFVELIPMIDDLQRHVKNLPGALLNFAIEQPFIDVLVMGIENSDQFTQNLNSLSKTDALPELKKNISESILIPSNWPK